MRQSLVIGGAMALLTAAGNAQTLPPAPGGGEETLLRYLIQQGGLVLAVAILFYVLRRDRDEQVRQLKATNDILIESLQANTRALTENAGASHRLARVVEDNNARRRRYDAQHPQEHEG